MGRGRDKIHKDPLIDPRSGKDWKYRITYEEYKKDTAIQHRIRQEKREEEERRPRIKAQAKPKTDKIEEAKKAIAKASKGLKVKRRNTDYEVFCGLSTRETTLKPRKKRPPPKPKPKPKKRLRGRLVNIYLRGELYHAVASHARLMQESVAGVVMVAVKQFVRRNELRIQRNKERQRQVEEEED